MTLSQIQTFLVVSDSLNFTKAARSLSVTQPAVSTQIQLLERELGVSLFNRIGRRVYLSQAGFLFRDLALEIIARVNRSESLLHSFTPIAKTDSLRIGTGFGAPQNRERFLQHYLHGTFQKRIPVKSFHGAERELVGELESGQADIVMFYHMNDTPSPFANPSEIRNLPVDRAKTLVLGSPGLSKDRWQRNVRILENFPVLLPPPDSLIRRPIEEKLHKLGLKTKLGIDTGEVDVLRKALLSGFGVGIFPNSIFRKEIESGELIGLSIDEVSFDCTLSAFARHEPDIHHLTTKQVALQILASGWSESPLKEKK
jgi:DNA-binding transcriptional LysR family regulator